MATYCTAAQVQAAASRWTALNAAEVTAVTGAIAQASEWVDQQTGQWFDERDLIVTTEAVSQLQKRLFLPAPLIELVSVSEDGNALDLDNVFNYKTYLEKRATATGFPGDGTSPLVWSRLQQSVVITGSFGFESVPADVAHLTAHIAAILLGWVTRNYTTGDGLPGSTLDLKVLPDWAQRILDARQRGNYDGQPFLLADAP